MYYFPWGMRFSTLDERLKFYVEEFDVRRVARASLSPRQYTMTETFMTRWVTSWDRNWPTTLTLKT